MKDRIINITKSLVPPVALAAYRKYAVGRGEKVTFSGNYPSWDEALRGSDGYDSAIILDRVRDALLKVKRGEAVYERDSVLFDKVQYAWPLLAGLLWLASICGNRLNLVDFGGSLGSTYYQNRRFLEHLNELKWGIVEQPNFVECGKNFFQNEQLKFYDSLHACLNEQHPNAILLCSVLPYLEKPYDLLAEVQLQGFEYILVDRTPFLENANDRITVQKVPAIIYPASYPAWFFNLEKFRNYFRKNYEMIAEFDSFEAFDLGDIRSQSKGFIFRKRMIEL